MSGPTEITGWPGNLNTTVTNVVRTRICTWAAPTFGDLGQSALHKALSYVAFALAIWSAIEQMRIFNMRYKLASDYAAISREEWDRFNAKYKPLEAMAVAECLSRPPYDPDYEAARNLGLQAAADGAARSGEWLAMMNRKYSVCPERSEAAGLANREALGADDIVNALYRHEESHSIEKKIRMFNRRANLLKLGRNLAAQAIKYASAADSLLGGVAQGLAQTTAGAVGFLGYIKHREITAYPESVIQGMVAAAQGGAGGFGLAAPMSVDSTG
jgi:hypothetical protein